MPKGKRRRKHIPHPKSYYDLSEVVQKINDGQLLIRQNAEQCALGDFGWGRSEIIKVYEMLKAKHFQHTMPSKINPLWINDVYKVHLFGEDVYTHFYINDSTGKLVINSFKRDQIV